MTEIHSPDGTSVERDLSEYWKITTTSVTWLHMLNTLSAKHEHKGFAAAVDPYGSGPPSTFYLDKKIYSADDIAGMLGKPIPEGKSEFTLTEPKTWAYVKQPTVPYYGEA